jgi:hypothetical protein
MLFRFNRLTKAVAYLAGVLLLTGVAMVLLDAAMPPSDTTALQIRNVEIQSWNLPRSDIHRMLIVTRGDYAAVATNIDFDNIELLKRTANGWTRITPNGWRHDVDKWAIFRAGVPWWTANALGNGLVRLSHTT